MRKLLLSLMVVLLLCPSVVWGQFKDEAGGNGIRLGEAKTKQWRAGVVVQAVGGSCQALKATLAVPIEWPEQEVKIVNEETTAHVKRISYRSIDDTVKQMVIEIPVVGAGQEARAIVTFEISRRAILAPEDTAGFEIPKRVPRALQGFLGPSPYIESRHPQIIRLAKQVTDDKESGWETAEAIYDHVREVVKYKDGPLKGALKALRDGDGDCEELSSLFIAMCRAKKIPARTVWVPGHCYPEFYLEDAEGKGHWFPCQAAGTRAFGEMPEQRPILQKGDNFRVPEKPKDKQRYVSPFLIGRPSRNGGKPKVRFIEELVE